MDAIAEWTAAQDRVIELVRDLDAESAGRSVPACPDWTVHDLLAHMIGLDADVLAGDEPDDHNATWTQRQVETRRGRTMADLVAEWQALTGPLQEWMRANGVRPLGDVIIHEQDLRGALGRPGAKDTAGLAAIRDRFAGRVADLVGDRPAVRLSGASWHFDAGTGEPAVEVRADEFELTRMLLSRRSAAQLRAATVRGDIEPYLDAFAALGDLPEHDLTE